MPFYGIDISNWQAGLNLATVKDEGFEAVICKVSEGSGYRDPTWRGFRNDARAAGLHVMGYHYVRADADPAAQAHTFVEHLGDSSIPCMLDHEHGSGGIDAYWNVRREIEKLGVRVALTYLPRWYWQSIGSPSLADVGPLMSSSYGGPAPVGRSGFASAIYPGNHDAGWNGYGGAEVAIFQFSQAAHVAGQRLDAWAHRGTRVELLDLFGVPRPDDPAGEPAPTPVGETMTELSPEQQHAILVGAQQWSEPHTGPVGPRPLRNPDIHNVRGPQDLWGRAALADLWNELVFDGYASESDIDAEPGSLVSFVLRGHAAAVRAAVDAAETRRLVELIARQAGIDMSEETKR